MYYWKLTPKQFEKHINEYVKSEDKRIREIDWSNYCLGKYIAFAVNKPRDYPKVPFLERVKPHLRERMSDDEMKARMVAIAKKINKLNKEKYANH